MTELISQGHANSAGKAMGGESRPGPRDRMSRLLPRLVPRSVTVLQIAFVMALLLPVFLVQLIIYGNEVDVQRDREYRANQEIARSVASTFEGFIHDILHEELILGLSVAIGSEPSPYITQTLLATTGQESPAVAEYIWADPGGRVVASSRGGERGREISTSPYYRQILDGQEWVVTDLIPGEGEDEASFVIARGIRDQGGALQGVMAATVDSRKLGSALQIPQTARGAFTITDRNGVAAYHYPEVALSWEQRFSTANLPLRARAEQGEEVAGTTASHQDGGVSMVGFVPIRLVGWVAGVARPESEVMNPLFQIFIRNSLLILLTGGAASLLALAIGRTLTVPLGRMRRRALQIAGGEIGGSVALTGPRELQELGDALNRMSRELSRREQAQLTLMAELEERNQALITANTQNLELVQRAESSADRLKGVQHVMEAALSHLVLDDLLNEILSRVRNLLEGDVATLLLVEKDGQSLAVQATDGIDAEKRRGLRVPMGSGIAGRIAARRQPAIFDRLLETDVISDVFKERVRAVVGVPLIVEDQVIGVIHVGSVSPDRFAEEDMALLKLVADRVALGIDRARLYEAEKEARAKAERQTAEMNALLENLGEAVTVCGRDGRILLRNRVAMEVSGISNDKLEERLAGHLPNVLNPDGSPMPDEEWPVRRSLRGEHFTDQEVLLVRPDGSQRRVLVTGSSVRDQDGNVALSIIVYRDITEMRDLEQTKEEYVSLISHDLRAPLSVVMGRAFMIQRNPDRVDQVQSNARSIVTSATRMNSMIQDLVDSSRLESGQMHLNLEMVDVEAFLSELKERMAGAMEMNRVTMDCEEGLHPVCADPDRLERILINLLTNALKYSEPSTPVRIAAAQWKDMVRLSIEDHGYGIAPEELPKLFHRYQRLARTGTKREGLGLGLYITRMLVENHGGQIWVESVLGSGSSFHFTLPTTPGAGWRRD